MTERDADASRPSSSSDVPASSSRPPRRIISPSKAGAVALLILALTPVWVTFGALGKVLTAPATTLSRAGLAALVLFACGVLAEVYYVETHHSDKFVVTFASADDTDRMLHELESERNFLQMFALLSFVLAALLVGQWRFHALVIACLDAPLTLETGARLLVDTVAPLFFVALLWDSVYALQHWQFVTSLTLGASIASQALSVFSVCVYW